MIRVFKNRSYNFAIERIKKLFDDYHVSYEILTPTRLKREYILHILKISDNGFEQIGKKLYDQVFGDEDIEKFTVNEMIDILLINPRLIKTPIIFNDTQLLVGYDPDGIRLFLPRIRQRHFKVQQEGRAK
jgi:regulatory protein spx